MSGNAITPDALMLTPPAEQASAPPAAVCRRSVALIQLLLVAIVVPWVSAWSQWQYYGRLQTLLGPGPGLLADLPLIAVFYLKTQLIVLPVAAIAALLVWRRWRMSAELLLIAWLALVAAWLEMDKLTYSMTGVHVLGYLQFVGETNATEWAGNLHSLSYMVTQRLKFVAAAWCIALLPIVLLSRMLPRWLSPASQRRAAWIVGGVYPLLLLSAALSQYVSPDRQRLQRAHAVMPIDITWTAPGLRLVDTSEFERPLVAAAEKTMREAIPKLLAGPPIDTAAHFQKADAPNVIVIVVESLRADAMTPAVMPRLCALSDRGMHLSNHFAGGRISHLGLFSLLFARTSAAFLPTTEHDIHPQACVTFAASGYRTAYVSSADHRGWMNMDRYVSDKTFDEMTLMLEGDWPTRDRRVFDRIDALLRDPPKPGPQFINAFVISTHFPYVYPPRYGVRSPVVPESWSVLSIERERDQAALRNRYDNSCGFMDDLLAGWIERLDLTNNIVVVTGDHGESLWDDGKLTHGAHWSDAQMRVPCLIVGAGVAPRNVEETTNHVDVLPTLLHLASGKHIPLRNVTGRDVLAEPEPAHQVLAAESQLDYLELLMQHGDRRMLFEVRTDRVAIIPWGSVDRLGAIQQFDIPPPADAKTWAAGIEQTLQRLTQLPPPAR